jgi:multidrug efflux system outer membrane protein
MKNIIVSLIISTFIMGNTFADDKAFVVNPVSIRKQLFSKNITLLQAMNNVEKSKLNVSMARANLLPKLNLGMLLPALANPTFLLGSVTAMFPFLVPSNWAALKQEKALFESDKQSYKALQLNVLSSALSLYYTYLNDLDVQKVYADQTDGLKQIYDNLKEQSEVLGNVPDDKLDMAEAQWLESKSQISKLEELIISEKAGVRTLLGLPLGAKIEVETVDLTPSDYENKSASEIAQYSLQVAPEAAQISLLISASKAGKFAKVMGFISSGTVSGTSSDSGSAFNNLKAGGSFSFGADNLVNVKLADNNIEAMRLRETQLIEENEKTAEIVAGQMIEVKKQQDLTAKVLEARMSVYEAQKTQYAIGLIPLQTLLLTQTQMTATYINNLKTDLDLKMQRLTLKRLVLEGDFAMVPGCSGNAAPAEKKWFGLKKPQTLDQVCQ